MRNLFKQTWGIALVLTAVACAGDDADSSESSQEAGGSGGSAATAGKTGSSAGSKSTPRAGTGATTGAAGMSGSTATPRGGSSAAQPTAAGKGGAGGSKGTSTADDDAGVPAAGGSGGSGGSSAHAGSGGATTEAGSGGSSASAATFTEVYALFSAGCAGAVCHVNATAPGGMLAMPDKATAYMNLINADAKECAGEKRVVPGDPAKSELVATLKHVQVGSCARTPRMPDNMPQWKESDIALVTSWVEAGAKND